MNNKLINIYDLLDFINNSYDKKINRKIFIFIIKNKLSYNKNNNQIFIDLNDYNDEIINSLINLINELILIIDK